MSKSKKVLFTFFSIIFVLIALINIPSIKAETPAASPEPEKEKRDWGKFFEDFDKKCNRSNLAGKYNIVMLKNDVNTNEYTISVTGEDDLVRGAEFKVIKVTKGNYYFDINSLPTIKKGSPLTLKIDSVPNFAMEGEKESEVDKTHKVVAVKVAMTTSRDGCLGLNDKVYNDPEAKKYGLKGNYYIDLESTDAKPIIADVNNPDDRFSEPNFNRGPGKVCTNFIEGIYNESQFNSKESEYIKKADFDKYNFKAVDQNGKDFYKDILGYCFNDKVFKGTNLTPEKTASMISKAITTWAAYSAPASPSDTSFDQAFDEIKNAAINSGHSYSDSSKLKFSSKCDYKIDKNNKDMYQNFQYYYNSQVVDSKYVKYKYRYAEHDVVETAPQHICDRTCHEAVKVEYGPPVASMAGLCFQYNVKVSSYVKCESQVHQKPPKNNPKICFPAPICQHGGNIYDRSPQAGPNADFDACINKCDGGKYSKKCSKKCYNEVYNEFDKFRKVRNLNGYKVKKLSVEDDIKAELRLGEYDWDGNLVVWRQGTQLCGSWYSSNGWTQADFNSPNWTCVRDGFRRLKSGSWVCDAYCRWLGCEKSKAYISRRYITEDYEYNLGLYKDAITTCKSGATCSRKTATYNMAIKYDSDKNEQNIVTKVYYPYTSDSKKVNVNEGPHEYDNIKKDEFLNGNGHQNSEGHSNSIVFDYDGCYKNVDNKKWYETAISFPGTYINNKTGEISFSVPSDISGWYFDNRKFCIPLNAKDVNKKWWERIILDDTSVTDAEIERELAGKHGTSNGYNIDAIVRNFGYFGWNFDIKCFYAIKHRSNELRNDPDSSKPVPKEDAGEEYIIRTIDKKNMFPNSKLAVDDDARREIGFNWTSNSKILTIKNDKYKVDPEKLINHIESTGDGVYSKDPDYLFYLTPSDLIKIRNYNKMANANKEWTWSGDSKIHENGVIVYKSKLFRGSSGVLPSESIKKLGTLGVNNEIYEVR